MNFGLNKIIIIGHAGQDPEIRYTQNNIPVCSINVGVNGKRKKNNEWQNHTEWFNVICFGKTAENATKFISKGKQIYVEGSIYSNHWEDKNGNKHIKYEIIANQIIFLGKNTKTNELNTNTNKTKNNIEQQNYEMQIKKDHSTINNDINDDDIPF